MGKVLIKLDSVDGIYLFHCPGCKCSHWFSTTGRTPANPKEVREQFRWTFNGDLDKPTVRASIMVKHGQGIVCHSFITDGKIEYLSDCTHNLKGKTVELEPYDID